MTGLDSLDAREPAPAAPSRYFKANDLFKAHDLGGVKYWRPATMIRSQVPGRTIAMADGKALWSPMRA